MKTGSLLLLFKNKSLNIQVIQGEIKLLHSKPFHFVSSAEEEADLAEIDYPDNYSDRIGSLTDESVQPRPKKVVCRIKSDLNLICEWCDCSFAATTSQSSYFQHLRTHESEVNGTKSYFLSDTYSQAHSHSGGNDLRRGSFLPIGKSS